MTEKISRYLEITNGGPRRRVLLSLPRVSWLERQPDYTPWPPLAEEPTVEEERVARPRVWHVAMRNDELTPQQREIWELHRKGLIVVEIARELGKSPNAISKSLNEARLKLGVFRK